MSEPDGSVFYRIGRLAGRKARKATWVWHSLTGDDDKAIEAEHGVGADMAAVVREKSGVEADPALRAQLDRTATALAGVVRNRLHRFEVGVVGDEQPTAYALPGGFIFLTASLADLCRRDGDELAFVVAHEMAHVIRRHAVKRVLRQTAYSAASILTPGRGGHRPVAASHRARVAGARLLARAGARGRRPGGAPDPGRGVRPGRRAAVVRAAPRPGAGRRQGHGRLSVDPPTGRRPRGGAATAPVSPFHLRLRRRDRAT